MENDFDADDSEDRAKTRAARDAARRAEDDDLKWLMSSKRGRRIVWKSLERASVFTPSFNSDALVMAFNEGMKEQGRKLLLQVQTVCPDMYFEMTKENIK